MVEDLEKTQIYYRAWQFSIFNWKKLNLSLNVVTVEMLNDKNSTVLALHRQTDIEELLFKASLDLTGLEKLG